MAPPRSIRARRAAIGIALSVIARPGLGGECVDYDGLRSTVAESIAPSIHRPYLVHVDGDRLFVVDHRLSVFDLSADDVRVPIGSVEVPSVRQLDVRGAAVYAAGVDVTVVDLSNEASPTIAGTISIEGTSRSSVAVWEDRLFVGTAEPATGIHVYDVASPVEPLALEASDVADDITCLVTHGGYLFVGTPSTVVVARIDGDDLAPVTTLDDPTNAAAMVVHGDVLYVSSGGGVFTFDVTDPAAPRALGRIDPGERVAVVGDHLFVSDHERVVQVDVDHVDGPLDGRSWLAGCVYDCCAFDLAASDDRVFVVHWEFGLGAADLRVPSPAPLAVLSEPTDGFVDRLLPLDGHAIGAGPAGLAWFDVSDPEAPVRRDALPTVAGVRHLEHIGNVLVAVTDDRVVTVDIASPDAFGPIGEAPLTHDAVSTAVANDVLFVSTGRADDVEGRLVAYDVTGNPARPVIVVDETWVWAPGALAGHGPHLAVGHRFPERFKPAVLDASDPRDLRLVWQAADRALSATLALGPEHLYVSNENVRVYDVTDPATNEAIADIAPPSECRRRGSMWLEDDLLYLADGALRLFDVGDPSMPHYVGDVGNEAWTGLPVDTGIVARTNEGLAVYPPSCRGATPIGSGDAESPAAPAVARLRVAPSPVSSAATVWFEPPTPTEIVLETFDVAGRRRTARSLGSFEVGVRSVALIDRELPTESAVVFVRALAGDRVLGVTKLVRAR